MIFESRQRLSRSHLWQLQRRFFAERRRRAWSEGVVPHYISSNPFLARAYGRIVVGFLRDWRPAIDPRYPIHIVELGAGAGRLGFHFLQQFRPALRLPALRDLEVRYVMTDFAAPLIEELREHPHLASLVAEGRLDFARFDAEAPEALRLLASGTVLAPGTPGNPLIVVANYVFDSLPQDLFRIENGALQEGLVTLAIPEEEAEPDDPTLLGRLQPEIDFVPFDGASYYGEPELDRLLDAYRAELDTTHLSFPSSALRCLGFLRQLSGGRLLLLSADKGYVHAETLLGREVPSIAIHGSISMSVNYHALAESFRAAGGTALYAQRRLSSLRICAFALGRPAEELAETRQAVEEALEVHGPDDFFTLKKGLEKVYDSLSAEELLAFLRLSGHDANLFFGMFPRLLALLPAIDEATRQELCRVARKVWELYLPLGEREDLAFDLGLLFATLDRCVEALEYFGCSLRFNGPAATTLYNMALCQARLHQLQPALDAVEEALRLEPGYAEARNLRVRLQSALADALPPR